MTLKESTFLLVICSFIFNTESYLIWESPYSVNTHNVLDGFHAVSSHSFGWSDSLSHSHDPTNSNRQVLKVSYRQGSYSQSSSHRGAQFYAQPSGSTGHTKMTLSYDVYFDSHFSWVRGGKLPGLFGGSMTCSGHRDTDHCFSTRMMWRAGGDGECYAYIPHNQQPDYDTWCRDSHIICNSNSGQSLGRGTFTFRKNSWQKVTQYVQLNNVGHHDGILKVWLDHTLVYENHQLLFRNHGNIHIDGLFFSTFFGGADASWASTADTYTLYRNFKLYSSLQDPRDIH